MKNKLNPDKDHVDKIIKGLKENKEKYGSQFCPCSLVQNVDTICPCLDYRENNHCHCNLFIN